MARTVDVEVIVTSTVTYRVSRPTKAMVVEEMGPEGWDPDDPETSIQEYLESVGIDDHIKGIRPASVSVDEKEISCVYAN